MSGRQRDGRGDIDRLLTAWMAEEGAGPAPTRLFESIHGRTRTERQARRWPWTGRVGRVGAAGTTALSLTTIAVTVVLAAAGLAILGRSPAAGPGASVPGVAPTATAQAASVPPLPTPDPVGTQLVREPICRDALTLAAAADASPPALWAGCADGARWASLPDASAVSLPIAGTSIVAAGGADAWAIAGDGIRRVGAPGEATGPVIPLPRATALAVGDGRVWVTTGDGDLVRVDPAAGTVAARTYVGSRPVAVAVAGGSVWVVARGDGVVVRVDAATGRILGRIPAGSDPALIATGAGAVWAASSSDGVITRIDARTGAALHVPQPGPPDPAALSGLGASDEAVYVGERGTLYRLDPATGATIGVTDVPPYIAAIAVVGEDPWVLVAGDATEASSFLVRVGAP